MTILQRPNTKLRDRLYTHTLLPIAAYLRKETLKSFLNPIRFSHLDI
jgi:hypothetical protein